MSLHQRAAAIAQAAYGHATQDPEEFSTLLERVLQLRPRVVLEIGVYRGGTLSAWADCAADDALIIGVDADLAGVHVRTKPGQTLLLIEGDSRDYRTQAKVRHALDGRAVDFLFIDGCHEEAVVKEDVATYPPLVGNPGIVAMHDVTGNDGVRNAWAPLRDRERGEEFFSDGKAHRMGIGCVARGKLHRTTLRTSLSIAILTYGHPDWLEGLLTTMDRYGWPDVPVRVFRDGPGVPRARETDRPYEDLCRRFGVPLRTLPEWGCIQRNAQQALEHSPEEWVLLIQDDNLVTPGYFEHLFRTLDEVTASAAGSRAGLLLPPFWHATDLIAAGYIEERDELLLDPARLEGVPINPGWGPMVEPRQYLSAHGSAFLVRRRLWEEVGGFSPSTWCYDEDLSCKTWLRTAYSVLQFNGPPLVHGMPGRIGCRPQPPHTFGLEQGWIESWGMNRADSDRAMRAAMAAAGGDGCPLSRVRPR